MVSPSPSRVEVSPPRTQGVSHLVHIVTFAICFVLLLFCGVASYFFSMHHLGVSAILIAAPVLIAPSLLPAACWHQQGNLDKRDAALTLPWLLLLMTIIPCVVVVSARLGMPLRDQAFMRLDQHLGFNVPAIMAWASRHSLVQHILNRSYILLFWMVGLAVFLPSLMGKRKAAQEFLLANAIVVLLAVPLFTCLPAVGPWVAYHFPPNPGAEDLRTLYSRTAYEFLFGRGGSLWGCLFPFLPRYLGDSFCACPAIDQMAAGSGGDSRGPDCCVDAHDRVALRHRRVGGPGDVCALVVACQAAAQAAKRVVTPDLNIPQFDSPPSIST